MILVVATDSAIDRVSVVRGFTAGARLHALRTSGLPGGSGIRTALAVRACGGSALVCGFAGGHGGTELRRGLDAHAVQHDLVEVKGETRDRVVVIDETRGDVLELAERGAPVTAHDVELLVKRVEGTLALASLVVLAGDLPPGAPEDLPKQLAAVVRAAGKPFLLDLRSEPLRRAIEERPRLAVVERADLELVLGVPIDDADALTEALTRFAKSRHVAALHPLGAEGALLAVAGRVVRFEIPAVRVWNSIGARETLLGALAWHLAERGDLIEAARFGCAAAACKLASEEPVHVDPREVEDLLPSVRLRDEPVA